MRLIMIDEYNEKTMQLARPIYDRHRRVLLAAGRAIHPKYLERLRQMDIKYLFVDDLISEGITMEELMDMPSWIEATEIVQKAFEAVKANKPLNIREMQKLAVKLVDEVSRHKMIIIIPSTSLAAELRPYAHAVNVALLSLQLGKKLRLNGLQMHDLAMGALLHDIGKAVEGDEHHALKGFEYLRKNREISLLSAHIAYQHHETFNGEGAPRKIHHKEIHQYAQICGIANRFENLISEEGIPPHEAMEALMAKSNIDFAQELVRLFVDTIPSYPPGTKVKMSDGREAIVTKIVNHMQRPYIRYLSTNEEISLAEKPTLLIISVINDKDKE
ncbi:MAG TPA: HD domain-containing phosphohydrolase [Anoxybacillus sp.]|jgi:putative nucleotidyltransferase with HDIG domain|nr:HD domain-containing phosphohydrolase [Anoxybacillus sp.]